MFFAVLVSLVSIISSEHTSNDYASAYRNAQQKGSPLMVVVGAEWCPACVTLKDQTLSTMKAQGEFQDVSLALVDRDDEPALAGKLMRGQTMPQIIVYTKRETGSWMRLQLDGYQSEASLRSMLDTAKKISGS